MQKQSHRKLQPLLKQKFSKNFTKKPKKFRISN